MTRNKKFDEIVKCYSLLEHQVQLIEECGELIQANTKFIRNPEKSGVVHNLLEEVADVRICLMELLKHLKTTVPNCYETVEEIIDEKLDRQLKRIESERDCADY